MLELPVLVKFAKRAFLRDFRDSGDFRDFQDFRAISRAFPNQKGQSWIQFVSPGPGAVSNRENWIWCSFRNHGCCRMTAMKFSRDSTK